MSNHSLRGRLVGWLLAASVAASAVGCDRQQATPESRDATPEPAPADPAKVALAKPAGNDDPHAPRAAQAEAKADVAAAPAAEEATDDDEDADEEPGQRRHAKRSKAPGRRRSSSAPEQVEAPAAGAPDAPLRLKRILFAPKIQGREPVDAEETFSSADTEKLYAFVELSNEAREATKITVTFIPPAGASSKVTLDVGDKPRWRTWALRKKPRAVGTWRVVVADAEGNKLGERAFEVTE